MKTIRVVAAVICDDLNHPTQVFATARGYGDNKGQWEFPGGKVEAGETPQQAPKRSLPSPCRWENGSTRSSMTTPPFTCTWTASGVS